MLVLEEKPIEVVHPEKPEVAVMLAPMNSLELGDLPNLKAFFESAKTGTVRLSDVESVIIPAICDWRGFERQGPDGLEPIPFSPDAAKVLFHGPTADALRYKGEVIDAATGETKEGLLYFHNLILNRALQPFSESPEGKV